MEKIISLKIIEGIGKSKIIDEIVEIKRIDEIEIKGREEDIGNIVNEFKRINGKKKDLVGG